MNEKQAGLTKQEMAEEKWRALAVRAVHEADAEEREIAKAVEGCVMSGCRMTDHDLNAILIAHFSTKAESSLVDVVRARELLHISVLDAEERMHGQGIGHRVR